MKGRVEVNWRWIGDRLEIISGGLKVKWRGTGSGSEVE